MQKYDSKTSNLYLKSIMYKKYVQALQKLKLDLDLEGAGLKGVSTQVPTMSRVRSVHISKIY